MMPPLVLGEHQFTSRLLTGTGRFSSLESTGAALAASGSQLCTLAVRRIDLAQSEQSQLLNALPDGMKLLPNTAGCMTADDALRVARLAREALQTDLVKLEILADPLTLYPNNAQTIIGAQMLIDDGFTVLPYCGDDPVVCRELAAIGCAAVMPLAAPIGSGLGVVNPHVLRLIIDQVDVPVIVDAGLGSPMDACQAMELGADAVLVNTAIAAAKDPIAMAKAFGLAVEAGYLCAHAGRIPKKAYATASSPLTDLSEATDPVR